MVITNTDIKLLYFLKRFLPPAYELIMRAMTWFVDHTLTRKTICHPSYSSTSSTA